MQESWRRLLSPCPSQMPSQGDTKNHQTSVRWEVICSNHVQPAAYESHGGMNMAQHKIITLLKVLSGGDFLMFFFSLQLIWAVLEYELCRWQHCVTMSKGWNHPQGVLTPRKSQQLGRKIQCQVLTGTSFCANASGIFSTAGKMKIFFSTLELKGTIYYLQVKNHWTIKIIGQKKSLA